jgi:hypothetical protein
MFVVVLRNVNAGSGKPSEDAKSVPSRVIRVAARGIATRPRTNRRLGRDRRETGAQSVLIAPRAER